MIKAIISNGVIVPRDPLPDDWHEGTEVAVERFPESTPANDNPVTDVWMDEVEALASQGDPREDQRLESALQEIQRREKDRARNRLGLEP
jgi:hypothetical protein